MTVIVEERSIDTESQKTVTQMFMVFFQRPDDEGDWLATSPKAKSSVERGLADLKAGRVFKRKSYAPDATRA
jgi:hypothetical protein